MKLPQALMALLTLAAVLTTAAGAQGQAAGSPGASGGKATLSGTVSNLKGDGVAGIVVAADNGAGGNQSATTDGQGSYKMEMPAGVYTISFVYNGGKIFLSTAVLSPGQILTLGVGGDLTAQPESGPGAPPAGESAGKGAITGTITNQSGTGISGATVTIENGAGTSPPATTDGQGLYFAELPAGANTVTVVVGGVRIFQTRAVLSPNQVLTLGVAGPPVAQSASLPGAGGSAPAVAGATAAAAALPAQAAPAAAEAQAAAAAPALQAAPAPTKGSPGSITGLVSDQTGAVVVGASVKVSTATGVAQSAVSDSKGIYLVKGLPPGSYTVTVTAAGFKDFTADHVNIGAGTELPLDASLEPAGEKTEVNVSGQTVSQVETENAEVSGTITEKEVSTLGLNGRNFTQLIALTPGVSNQTGQDEAHVGVTGSVKYSVNGGRVEYNTFEVDGSDVLNAGLNGAQSTLVVYPSLDAIQEVKVLTSNYGAQFGRTASGTVLVRTKSGTAQWHGGGYEYFRNEALNARNYFDQTSKAPLYRRNDFGFNLGGPVYIPNTYNVNKDKTFFFWSEEWRYEKSPSDLQPDFNHGVPSLAERGGNFSDVCPAANDPRNPAPGVFLRSLWPDCPAAGVSSAGGLLEFPNNNISQPNAAGTIDQNALALLSTNLIPLPNSTTGCNSTIGSCYDAVISLPTHWREDLIRVDHNFTQNVQLSVRYIHDSWSTTTPIPEWGYVQNSFPTVQNNFVGPGVSFVTHLTQTISPTLLNEFTASYVDSHITLNNLNGPGGANYQRPASLGVPGGPCTSQAGEIGCPMGAIFANGFGGKTPGIVIGGTNAAYGGNGFAIDPAYMPWEHTNPTYSVRDDLSKSVGKHIFHFGVQAIFYQRNQTNGAIGAATGDVQGLLTFSNINGGAANTGNAFANLLTLFTRGQGVPGVNAIQSYTQDSTQYRYYQRYNIGEPYVQDDWKVTPRLTLNLGVRFSLFGLYHEKYLRAYNWTPATYSPALASQVTVDPATGQLLSRSTGTAIPIDLASPDPRLLNGIVQCGVQGVPNGCMTGHVFNPAPRVGFAWDPFGDGKTSIRSGYGIFYEHGTGDEANTGSLEASAPIVLNLTQRFPSSYGCIGGSAGATGGCTVQPGAFPLNVTEIPTHAVWSYSQQWSLSIQRQLPGSMVATFGYVGSKGTHLTVERQVNQVKPLSGNLNPFGLNQPLIPESPTSALLGDCGGYVPTGTTAGFHLLNGTTVGPTDPAYVNLIAACAGANSPINPTPDVNTLRPYPGLGEIFFLQNGADSSYQAFQTTLRRTKGPVTLGVSYSYSHSIDDSSDRSDSTFVNSYDLRSNRASSNFDQRHLLNVSYIYTLPNLSHSLQDMTAGKAGDSTEGGGGPAGSTPSRFLQWLGDGWQFSGITVFQSGTPFSVINGGSGSVSVLDNAGVANGVGAGSYPDVARNPAPPPNEAFNTNSFGPLLGNPNQFVAPRALTFGDAGRNFLNNPHRLNFDMSLLKHFKVREFGQLEFRAEAFNVFNHTQFRIYDPNLGNTGSNVISCYGGPNYSAGFVGPTVNGAVTGTDCVNGSAFLHPVDAHRGRTMQLALKYTF